MRGPAHSRQKSLNRFGAKAVYIAVLVIDRCPNQPLNRPGSVPPVGQHVAAGVSEHMRVRFQFEAEPSASGPLYHPRKAGSGERRTALADEDEWRRFSLTL